MKASQQRYHLIALLIAGLFPFSAYAIDANQILINISTQIGPFQTLVKGAAYLLGLGFVGKGLYHLKVYGEARAMMSVQTSIRTPVTYFVVGAMLIYLPTAVDIMMMTTFGTDSLMAYPGNDKGLFATTMNAVFLIVRFIGLVSFVRGWVLLAQSASQSGSQPGSFGKGVTHIIGGALALNIVLFVKVMSNTLGVDFGV